MMNHLQFLKKSHFLLAVLPFILQLPLSSIGQDADTGAETLKLKFSLGHKSVSRSNRMVQLKAGAGVLSIARLQGVQLEKNDRVEETSVILNCGAGDVDEILAQVSFSKPTAPFRKLAGHKDGYSVKDDAMWGFLMEHGSEGQSQRLKDDQWYKPDAPVLTVLLNKEGTDGFSIALEQLIKHGAMWLPEQDVFVSLADNPVDFKTHLASLKGTRVLDEVLQQPEASLEGFKKQWADIGDPYQWDESWQTRWMGTRGHLTVTAAAHGSVYKFAIDRWANVRPDFASPHKFRLDFNWPKSKWKQQKINNGLPIISTSLENDGQSAEVEQFAAPLYDISTAVRGYIPSVLLTQLQFSGKATAFNFDIAFGNEVKGRTIEAVQKENHWLIVDQQSGDILLLLETAKDVVVKTETITGATGMASVVLKISGTPGREGKPGIIVKLPSPSIKASAFEAIRDLTFEKEKSKLINYWEQWLAEGAYFNVPEPAVNELFRANLWHSLILPRHTLDIDGKDHMDLPYANTAYGQRNADWPINQAVYVDYMIYGLRGHEKTAQDEYAAMFKSQQQPDGRVGGFANWGVYSPGQLYAIAQNFLLSGNKENFEKLLPNCIKTLDWCLLQVAKASIGSDKTGLIVAPLNDLTNTEKEWAFNQAYYVGGLETFAKALSLYQHPRAEEVAKAAAGLKAAVVREFSRSSVVSPIVQLADGSWINFVPTDALTPRRMMEQWYPTDVDCGPLHLTRLGVIDAQHWLTTAMLHDHEDNLFFKNQGAANEPVYVQQATPYFLRDEPKAVIRAFYSLMACGFSHQQYTSLEHRWAWGQYYGPPSTDGAWFEIYRKMLLNEWGNDTLIIGQAIPRKWLGEGKKIEVKNAPTYFGNASFVIEGLNAGNEIKVSVQAPARSTPKQLLLRLRHPEGKNMQSVLVNGKPWKNFDVKKEYISIPAPSGEYHVTVKY